MKTLTAFVAAVALVAGVSVASAASQMEKMPTTAGGATTQSHAATMSKMDKTSGTKKVIGRSEFCAQKSDSLKCTYTTMASCHSANKANGWTCVQNPSSTTGEK